MDLNNVAINAEQAENRPLDQQLSATLESDYLSLPKLHTRAVLRNCFDAGGQIVRVRNLAPGPANYFVAFDFVKKLLISVDYRLATKVLEMDLEHDVLAAVTNGAEIFVYTQESTAIVDIGTWRVCKFIKIHNMCAVHDFALTNGQLHSLVSFDSGELKTQRTHKDLTCDFSTQITDSSLKKAMYLDGSVIFTRYGHKKLFKLSAHNNKVSPLIEGDVMDDPIADFALSLDTGNKRLFVLSNRVVKVYEISGGSFRPVAESLVDINATVIQVQGDLIFLYNNGPNFCTKALAVDKHPLRDGCRVEEVLFENAKLFCLEGLTELYIAIFKERDMSIAQIDRSKRRLTAKRLFNVTDSSAGEDRPMKLRKLIKIEADSYTKFYMFYNSPHIAIGQSNKSGGLQLKLAKDAEYQPRTLYCAKPVKVKANNGLRDAMIVFLEDINYCCNMLVYFFNDVARLKFDSLPLQILEFFYYKSSETLFLLSEYRIIVASLFQSPESYNYKLAVSDDLHCAIPVQKVYTAENRLLTVNNEYRAVYYELDSNRHFKLCATLSSARMTAPVQKTNFISDTMAYVYYIGSQMVFVDLRAVNNVTAQKAQFKLVSSTLDDFEHVCINISAQPLVVRMLGEESYGRVARSFELAEGFLKEYECNVLIVIEDGTVGVCSFNYDDMRAARYLTFSTRARELKHLSEEFAAVNGGLFRYIDRNEEANVGRSNLDVNRTKLSKNIENRILDLLY